jgi:c-type cytochrome biogenesis protein CcmF
LGIYGLILMRTAGGYERWVMTVYGGVVLLLMAILAFQSPFAPLPKPDPAPAVWPPRDGFGLNPVLENPWMKIHPPIIFAGFAALSVPFAYAIAALWRNEYHEFAVRVRPWAIYSATMLGFGLALGGYWAYETLGWGGFWAWDPVENSSYFPWLFMAAGMHGLLLQLNRGRMVRWNPLLLALPHLLFLYGTFLTRSGALAEVSVHSFVNMETNALKILLGMLIGSVLLTLGLWAWRYRQMPLPAPNQTKGVSREAAVRWGIALLSISALISLIGTSWPLITKAVGKQMEALKPEFYNQVHIPWIVITAIALAAAPMLTWRGMSLDQALERLTKSWLAAVATGFVLFFLGFREPITLLICTLVAFTAYANAGAIWRRFRTSRLTLGGFITHLGLALAILGLILSYAYERKERVVILQGQDAFAMGYKWRYLGMTGNEKFPRRPAGGQVQPRAHRDCLARREVRRGAALLSRPTARDGQQCRLARDYPLVGSRFVCVVFRAAADRCQPADAEAARGREGHGGGLHDRVSRLRDGRRDGRGGLPCDCQSAGEPPRLETACGGGAVPRGDGRGRRADSRRVARRSADSGRADGCESAAGAVPVGDGSEQARDRAALGDSAGGLLQAVHDLGVAGSAVDAAGRAAGDAAPSARCALRGRPHDGRAVPDPNAEARQTARTRPTPRQRACDGALGDTRQRVIL